jgi:hypothetical protein
MYIFLFLLLSAPIVHAEDPPHAAEDSAAELVKIKENQQGVYNSLNQSNPFSTTFGTQDPNAPGGLPENSGLATIQRVLASPMTQGMLKAFSNPALANSVDQIYKSPKRMILLYCEIGWFFLIILFRAWRSSKLGSANWFQKIWLSLWTSLAFCAGSSILLPWMVLGEPYSRILSIIYYSFLNSKG